MENIISLISLVSLPKILDFVARTDVFATTLVAFSIPLSLLAISFFFLIKSPQQYFEKRVKQHPLPPGPNAFPIVGCLPQMLANRPTFRWIHKLMNDMNTEIACIRIGNVHVIPVTCPSISQEFLYKQDAIFASRPLNISSHITSNGFLTTILSPFGDQWKKMTRVLAAEVLSPTKLGWFYGKRLEEADHLVCYIYNQCNSLEEGSGLVNVRVATQHYCGNVIRKMMFSKRFFGEGMKNGGPGFEEEEHVNAIFTILAYLFSFRISDYFPCLIGLDLDGHEKAIKEANKIIKKYHDPIIEERVQQWRNDPRKEVEDMLDVLLTLKDANGNPLLTTEEINAQITVSYVHMQSF